VNYGGSTTAVTAVPNSGYHFVNWTDAGNNVIGTNASVTVPNVTGNMNLTASFAADPVDGACGTANGQTLTSAPTTGLCTAGASSAVTGAGPWSWSCAGQNGGTNASCSASVQTYTINYSAGAGGTLTGTTSQTVNYGGSTTAVTAVPDSGYHFVNWTDAGNNVISTNATVTVPNVTGNMNLTASFAADPVDGACGTANGQTLTSAPTTGLCSTGTASAVTGTGPWGWSCEGSNGGATATCSANIQTSITNVSTLITVIPSGFVYNRTTGRFHQQITLRNASGNPIQAPIYLVLDNLSANASLANASGTTSNTIPAGSPYIQMMASGSLAAGNTVSVLLQFDNPTRTGIIYSTRVLAGPGTP
jgi:uncharacterized repeat protein (TIGR02543 family)